MKKILLLALVVSSCAPVYVPNIRNTPMFTKGGEFQLAGQAGNGIDGQAALSVTNHIGLMANYSYINRNTAVNQNAGNANDDEDFLRHKFFEGGIGYFTQDEDMFFEVFAGYGKGEGYSSGNFFGVKNASGKYERYFIQPAFGMNKKTVQFSFVPRISVVDFTEYTLGSSSIAVTEEPKIFFEPAFVTRVNTAGNHFFFTFQAGMSAALSDDIYFDRRRFQFATGIGIRLGGMKEEIQPTKTR
jgi:hypothetical protein